MTGDHSAMLDRRYLPVLGAVIGSALTFFVLTLITRGSDRAAPPSVPAEAAPVTPEPPPTPPPVVAAPEPEPERAEPEPAAPSMADQMLAEAAVVSGLDGDALVGWLEDWAATQADVTYAMLERNPRTSFGERVVFTGRVEEIHDTPNGGSSLRVATRAYGDDVLWIETIARPSQTIVQGSRVRVYGYLAGPFTYQSQAGWTITLPSLIGIAVVPASTPARLSARARARLTEGVSP